MLICQGSTEPFTNGLQKLNGRGAGVRFTNLYRFVPNLTAENELDILLIDEAQRVEKSSNHQSGKSPSRRSREA